MSRRSTGRRASFLVASGAVFAMARLAGAQQGSAPDPDARENVQAREAYFWLQRSYPSSERPYAAMARIHDPAFLSASRIATSSRSITPSSPSVAPLSLLVGSWRALGPYGEFGADNGYFGSGGQLDAGRVTAVVPGATQGVITIGTASGGIWRTTNDGYSWTAVSDGLCSLNIGAMTADPVKPDIMYAATGEGNTVSYGCGILRSTDAGATWAAIGGNGLGKSAYRGGGMPSFTKLYVDSATAGSTMATTLLASSEVGLFRSTSSGASWTNVQSGIGSTGITALPGKPAVLFAGSSDYFNVSRRGIWRSTDFGANWSLLALPAGLSQSDIGRIELATTPAAPNRIYALIGSRTTQKLLALLAYDDVAGTWTQLGAAGLYDVDRRGNFGGQAYYDFAIAVDPADANRIYVAGIRAYRSLDGGATFRQMGGEIHCDWHQIVVDPRDRTTLYAATDGGVFMSRDWGDSWTSRNAGLVIAQYYPGISADPKMTVVMGGSQDNGTHTYTGTTLWDGFSGGDGGFTAVSYNNPSIRWSEAQWSSAGAYIVRRDATSVRYPTTGIAATDRAEFIPPLVMDPVVPSTLYFGTNRLYRTTDEQSWTSLTPDLSRGSGSISAIAIGPSDPKFIYVGTSDGLIRVSSDAGLTFGASGTGVPNRYVTHVAVDPTTPAHAVATLSGFGSVHVIETTDAGLTWKSISGGLADVPTNAIAFIGGSTSLIIGTDIGTFQTIDGGVTWSAGPAGMPTTIVNDLLYLPVAQTLIAATYGRGMWSLAVGAGVPVLRGDVNGDGKVDALDALLIQQALVGEGSGAAVMPRGDANCNGWLESADVVLVLRAAVGLASSACVNTIR